MEFITLSVFLLISVIFNIFLVNYTLSFLQPNKYKGVLSSFVKSSKPSDEEGDVDDNSEYLSSFINDIDYKERIARDLRFEKRMEETRNELIKSGKLKLPVENVAEELHPLVHNLPHDSVRLVQKEVITEVAK